MLFGDNIEWANEGMGVWRPDLHGFDPEIVDMLRESGVTHLRYPGGTLSDYFHWSQAIGPTRTPQVDPFNNGATQMPDFGPDEFMALCRTLGIKGSITLNAGTGTPQEAAAWVKYSADQGFDVTPYEVGNEIYMVNPASPEVPSLPIYKTAQQYVTFYEQCLAGVKSQTSGAKLGGIGIDDTGPIKTSYDPNWLTEITAALGSKMAFVAPHDSYAPLVRTASPDPNSERYASDVFAECMMAASVYVQSNIDATKALIESASPDGKDIPLHITESGPLILPVDTAHSAQDLAWNPSLVAALYEACLLNVYCRDPEVQSANHLPLCQAVFGALIGIDGSGPTRIVWRNAVFYVLRDYARMSGRSVLGTTVSCPTYATPQIGGVPAIPNAPCLDAGAYETKSGGELSVFLINRDVLRGAAVSIDPGSRTVTSINITTLSAPSYLAQNSPEHPREVVPATKTIPSPPPGPFSWTVPKHAFVEIDFESGKA
jgi:alpha-N-arabinofuranosidase